MREIRAGFRPITSDGYPLFGRTNQERIFVATGTYRNGVLMAPAIAKCVADEITSTDGAQASTFSPMNRSQLFKDKDPAQDLLAAIGQMVSFMQEPDGNLPFDRAGELERLVRGLLSSVINRDVDNQVQETVNETLAKYPIQEALPLILYEMNS